MDKMPPPPPAPRNVKVSTDINLQTQIITFTEVEVNGLVQLNPPKIMVPVQSIMVIAAQVILAMAGVTAGQASSHTSPGPGENGDSPNLRLT